MKFIHIADVHIGARPEAGREYSAHREREILDTFKRVLEQCERDRIDLLLIAGGLFHRQPLLRELKEINYLFSKLSVTRVVFVVGNDDYLCENSYYRTFKWSQNVYPILSSDMSCIELSSLEVAVYGCSYYAPEEPKKKFIESKILANQKYHIMLGHGGCESYVPCSREDLEQLPYDYIALGHQHKPEILQVDRITYAGALEPIQVEDVGAHGYMQGTIVFDQDGVAKTEVHFVEFASREYVRASIEVTPSMSNEDVKQNVINCCMERGIQHIFEIELIGSRSAEISFVLEEFDRFGNIIRIEDHTYPHYNLKQLVKENKENLLGAYIKSFGQVREGSVEHQALLIGIEAIEETKKG